MPQAPHIHESDTKSLIALGSNVTSLAGGPSDTLRAALAALETDSVRVLAVSRLFSTPCFPPGAGADFVNAVCEVASRLDAEQLLQHLHAVERRFGRERRTRWAARTLDLDLLDHGGQVLPDLATYRRWREMPLERQKAEAPEQLILPHPRLDERAFVLVPLADVAPGWRHPVTGRSVAGMLADLPRGDVAAVRPL